MRTLEVVYKDIARSKITIAKDRITFKFPLRLNGRISMSMLDTIYRYCDTVHSSENTMRGRFVDDKETVCFQYDNGDKAISIKVSGLIRNE